MRTLAKTRTPSHYIECVNLAIDHVINHLAEPLRLDRVARAAHLSPFHFHRVFQVLVGETIADFVKRLRLEKALVQMAHSRRSSLTAIAFSCGFSSSSDFSRSFRQCFGVSPSKFDIKKWRDTHASELKAAIPSSGFHVNKLPPVANPDHFRVRIRDLPARTVAYIRVTNPYEGNAVAQATSRLIAWAERNNIASNQWLGYQWDNPEFTALENCHYYVAVEAPNIATPARGEIGRFRFPAMTVAEIEIRGDIHLELRALQWLYGTWLPKSRYVPADHPGFESWIGRPFAHGTAHFEIHIQLPVKQA
ncbi:MAG: AraC family transcriptional regulator [Phycisphaerales bacterium]